MFQKVGSWFRSPCWGGLRRAHDLPEDEWESDNASGGQGLLVLVGPPPAQRHLVGVGPERHPEGSAAA